MSTFDFSLCRQVLENSQATREKKTAVRESRRARIAVEEEKRRAEIGRKLDEKIERFTQKAESLAAAAVGDIAKCSLPSPSSSPTPIQASVAASRNDYSSILTPLPMPAPTKISSPEVPAKQPFNISDFEADTSSPFDNMELKTINEMEELAHVLQPNCTSDIRPKDTFEYSNYYPQATVCNNTMGKNEIKEQMTSVDVFGTYGHVPQNNCNSQINGPRYDNHQQYSFPTQQQQQQSNYYFPNQQSWMYTAPNSTYPYNVPPNLNPQSSYSTSVQPYSPAATEYTNTISHSNPSDPNFRSRSSKSVPDIFEELQREASFGTNRSIAVPVPKVQPMPVEHIQPPRPASFGSTGLENWKPWPELDSPVPPEPQQPPKPVVPPKLKRPPPDPIARLPEAVQQLARQLNEMGFPLDRVARACETVGQDHKKVLDYLLQVQTFEEKGFPVSQVEFAIGKLSLDEPKALKFLPALGQLVDLGFSEEQASTALLKTNFDRDKALDTLLS
ncbi:hypothetical protein B566_EDAN000735 [Ephemera danica]|nr:hypothetical protein B566_EDAN000735 [Ephemera danica]